MSMIVCDQRGCTARAIREIMFDNRHSLWMCSHHTSQHFTWITPEVRFDLEPSEIVT